MQGLLAIPSAEGEGGVYWTVETNELTGKGFRWSLRQTEGGGVGVSEKTPRSTGTGQGTEGKALCRAGRWRLRKQQKH